VRTIGACSFEVFPLLNFVLKRERFFRCYKLCGTTQIWVEHVTSRDTMQIVF
jgi:hypothetical protein